MNTDAFSAVMGEQPRGILRALAVPLLIAALVCASVFLAGIKWRNQEPAPAVARVKWHITWVELSDFEKPREAAQKQKR